MMRSTQSQRKLASTTALTLVAALALAPHAWADNVTNDVSAGSGLDTFPAGGSTTIGYRIVATGGDGQAGCNAADGTPATLVVHTPSGLTANPHELMFSSCGDFRYITFASGTPGTYLVTVTVVDAGAGTYHTNPATVTIQVEAASDVTPPFITIEQDPVPATAVTNAGAVVFFPMPSAMDDVDGAVPVLCSHAPGDTFALGQTPVTCTAADAAGNVAEATFTVWVTYDGDFFLPPFRTDSITTFKAPRTLPVKFQLVHNSPITNAIATLSLQSGPESGTASLSAHEAEIFRYDPEADQYVLNVSTKGVPPGTYEVVLEAGDGVHRSAWIELV
jgi:hypothetical protein